MDDLASKVLTTHLDPPPDPLEAGPLPLLKQDVTKSCLSTLNANGSILRGSRNIAAYLRRLLGGLWTNG